MINVTLQYRLTNSGAWTSINTFQRPIMYSEKIDETLDFGKLVFQATEELNLPPFAQLRLVISDNVGGSLTISAVAGTPEKTMVRST